MKRNCDSMPTIKGRSRLYSIWNVLGREKSSKKKLAGGMKPHSEEEDVYRTSATKVSN